jgi:hypothetical protein
MWQKILSALLFVLDWLIKRAKPKAEEGEGPGKREDRLRDKIREDGWDNANKG